MPKLRSALALEGRTCFRLFNNKKSICKKNDLFEQPKQVFCVCDVGLSWCRIIRLQLWIGSLLLNDERLKLFYNSMNTLLFYFEKPTIYLVIFHIFVESIKICSIVVPCYFPDITMTYVYVFFINTISTCCSTSELHLQNLIPFIKSIHTLDI